MSRISIPLIPLSKKNGVPIIMTLMSGDWDHAQSSNTIRFYSTADDYVKGSDEGVYLQKYNRVAVLSVNDDYGKANVRAIKETVDASKLIDEETYAPSSNDFRTQLSSIKSKKPDAFLIVATTPAETINVIKQAREIGINCKYIEASITLNAESTRKDLGDYANGVYTKSFAFDLGLSPAGKDFIATYQEKYKNSPQFPAAYGYDIVNYIVNVSGQKPVSGKDFIESAKGLKSVMTLNGETQISNYQEINPPLLLTEVVNGKVVLVK